MNEQDKQVIERLAELLGWSDCRWAEGYTHNKEGEKVYHYQRLHGVHKDLPERKSREDFPPSIRDGNGMLWLMGELCKLGYGANIGLAPDESAAFVHHEHIAGFHGSIEYSPNLPEALNKAALKALETRT